MGKFVTKRGIKKIISVVLALMVIFSGMPLTILTPVLAQSESIPDDAYFKQIDIYNYTSTSPPQREHITWTYPANATNQTRLVNGIPFNTFANDAFRLEDGQSVTYTFNPADSVNATDAYLLMNAVNGFDDYVNPYAYPSPILFKGLRGKKFGTIELTFEDGTSLGGNGSGATFELSSMDFVLGDNIRNWWSGNRWRPFVFDAPNSEVAWQEGDRAIDMQHIDIPENFTSKNISNLTIESTITQRHYLVYPGLRLMGITIATPPPYTPLNISKEVDKKFANASETLEYTISYKNEGFIWLNNVTITDTIPDNTELWSNPYFGNYNETNRTLIWDIGTLPPSWDSSVSYQVRINDSVLDGTRISNYATVTSDEFPIPKSSNLVTIEIGHTNFVLNWVHIPQNPPWDRDYTVEVNIRNTGYGDGIAYVGLDVKPIYPRNKELILGDIGDGNLKNHVIPAGGTYTFIFHVSNSWEWIKQYNFRGLFYNIVLINFGLLFIGMKDIIKIIPKPVKTYYSMQSYINSIRVAFEANRNQTYIYTPSSATTEGISFNESRIVEVPSYKQESLTMAVGFSAIGVIASYMRLAPHLSVPFLIISGASLISSFGFYSMAYDPDPNFTDVAVPQTISIAEVDNLTDSQAKKVSLSALDLLALTEAMNMSWNRYAGAKGANDSKWMIIQLQAARNYTDQSITKTTEIGSFIEEIVSQMPEPTEADIEEFKNYIETKGLPSEQMSIYTQLGYTPEEINIIEQGLLDIPDSVYLNLTNISKIFDLQIALLDELSNESLRLEEEIKTEIGQPMTIINIAGTLNQSGWYSSDAVVSLVVNNMDPANISKTEYSFDKHNWLEYYAPFTINGEGTTSIYARSTSILSITEDPPAFQTVRIDKTPPVTTYSLEGTIDAYNRYVSNVNVTLNVTDNLNGSGAVGTYYRLNGGNWTFYSGPFVISKEGITTMQYYSIDNAGNAETIKSVDINRRTFFPPILAHIDDIIVNETELVRITATATDPENDTLTFSYSYPLNSSGVWQTTCDDAGVYIATVTVSDGYTNVSQDVKITVLNVNRPPVLSPAGTLTALEDTYFVYHVNATDPDNDQLAYYDNTSMFDINLFTGEIGFTPRNVFVGNHSVNISVSDGYLTDSQIITLVIKNTNNPPAVEFVFPQTAFAGTNFTLQVNATDPDGDQLTFSDDADMFEINSTTGLIQFVPISSDIGVHFVNISVTDGIESDTVVLNLVVRPGGRIKLEPIEDIIAYAGDLVKIIVNYTHGR